MQKLPRPPPLQQLINQTPICWGIPFFGSRKRRAWMTAPQTITPNFFGESLIVLFCPQLPSQITLPPPPTDSPPHPRSSSLSSIYLNLLILRLSPLLSLLLLLLCLHGIPLTNGIPLGSLSLGPSRPAAPNMEQHGCEGKDVPVVMDWNRPSSEGPPKEADSTHTLDYPDAQTVKRVLRYA